MGCEEGFTCLDSDDPTTRITFNNISHIIELISASDTTATIKVGKTRYGGGRVFSVDTKEVNEGASKEINGLNIYVKEADERNLEISVILKVSEITVSCETGCSLDGKCYPYNDRKSENYCAVGGAWMPQLESGSACNNNFECGTNICAANQCIDGNLLQKIIAQFRNIFG